MARPTRGDELLITYLEAARLLSITKAQVESLITSGHLRRHPKLTDRIARLDVQNFALNYETATDASSQEIPQRTSPDAPFGRTLHVESNDWDIPSFGIR